MKKILIALIKKHYNRILQNWVASLVVFFGNKISRARIKTLVETSLSTLIEVVDSSDYAKADQFLIEMYNLSAEHNLDLLGVSQVFSNGRYAIINHLEEDKELQYDPLIILGFVEEIIEQIFARYAVLHQDTRMKELEYDRDRLKQKLDMNQQYLHNILHSAYSAIMVLDENDRFIAWNKGATNIFGYTEKEVLGKTPEFLFPDDRKYEEELNFIRQSVKTRGFFQILETERKAKNGNLISIQLNVSILTNNAGDYAGRSVIVRDYTETKHLQQQIDQSEKLAVLGQMAAGIAHEIGNPLTSISSLVQILQRRADTDYTKKTLVEVKDNIDRISKIVRELVDFSRPPGLERSIIYIDEIVKTALGIVKYDKRVKEVDFKTDLAKDPPKISVIPDQLLQVFVNILFNALDAIEGRGKIKIKTKFDSVNIYTHITDNGCGIPEENIGKLFEPFFTTKTVGKGTGLGLSVSYGIIKKFSGDILVESEIKKGSTFIIVIPVDEN
ncbi:MAG: nitrogen regulation protein NR(II) [Rhodothermaceae bacterium]